MAFGTVSSMNPFNVHWSSLDLSPPVQTRISVQTIKKWQGEDQLLRQVRGKAARCLLRARQMRLATRQSGRQYFQLMRKRSQAQRDIYYQEAQDQAVQEGLRWLIDTQQIEQEIASHLEQKAQEWAIAALKTLIGEIDNQQLLLEHLRVPVAQAQEQGALTLHANPEQMAAVEQAFGAIPQLTVVADPSLKPTQAVLESHLLLVKIDLERHLNLLIEQLQTHLPEIPRASQSNKEQKTAHSKLSRARQPSKDQQVASPEPADAGPPSEEYKVTHE